MRENSAGEFRPEGRLGTAALWLRSFFFGEKCAGCGRFETGGDSLFCPACEKRLRAEYSQKCPLCGRQVCACLCTAPGMDEAGGSALIKSGFYDPLDSASPLGRAVIRLKDSRDRLLAGFLMRRPAQTLTALLSERGLAAGDCVAVWVPRSRARIRITGTDQAKLLARALAGRTGIARAPALVRSGKRTGAQKALSAHGRESNVSGMFRVSRPESVRGRTAVLVDDLVTTGATLNECCRLLREAGASDVICVCALRTALR